MTIRRTRPAALPALRLALAALAAAACGDGGASEDAPSRLDALVDTRRWSGTAPDRFRARFETTAGPFVVEVRREWAPLGADRFWNLVRAGYYDSVYVHRVIPGRLAQFGIHGDPRVNHVWARSILPDDPVRTSNLRGRVSFASSGPNSRANQLFLALADLSALDEDGFAPIGEIVEGMDAVDAFHAGYGDGPPRGEGPYAAQAAATGNAYLAAEFPELTQILSARIEG